MRLEEGKENLVCDYCGGVHYPDPNERGIRVLGEPAGVECSLCSVPMVHAAIAGQRILYCPQCRGILIGMDIFGPVIQALRSHGNIAVETLRPPNWEDLRRKMDCPRCGKRMVTHLYGGPGNIIIDNCEACNLNWLDDGELQRVLGAPDRQ